MQPDEYAVTGRIDPGEFGSYWMANLPPKRPPSVWRHAGIGLNFSAAVAGFGLAGWWVDSRWDTRPWGVLIGVALGLIGATYNLVRESMAAFDELPERKDKHRSNDSKQE